MIEVLLIILLNIGKIIVIWMFVLFFEVVSIFLWFECFFRELLMNLNVCRVVLVMLIKVIDGVCLEFMWVIVEEVGKMFVEVVGEVVYVLFFFEILVCLFEEFFFEIVLEVGCRINEVLFGMGFLIVLYNDLFVGFMCKIGFCLVLGVLVLVKLFEFGV